MPLTNEEKKGPWTREEDACLLEWCNAKGASDWVGAAARIPGRCSKQCRERYHQNLKPGLNHDPISDTEGREICRLVTQKGQKWAQIARELGTSRSDNAIKNWWNGWNNRVRRQRSRLRTRQLERQHSAPLYSENHESQRSPTVAYNRATLNTPSPRSWPASLPTRPDGGLALQARSATHYAWSAQEEWPPSPSSSASELRNYTTSPERGTTSFLPPFSQPLRLQYSSNPMPRGQLPPSRHSSRAMSSDLWRYSLLEPPTGLWQVERGVDEPPTGVVYPSTTAAGSVVQGVARMPVRREHGHPQAPKVSQSSCDAYQHSNTMQRSTDPHRPCRGTDGSIGRLSVVSTGHAEGGPRYFHSHQLPPLQDVDGEQYCSTSTLSRLHDGGWEHRIALQHDRERTATEIQSHSVTQRQSHISELFLPTETCRVSPDFTPLPKPRDERMNLTSLIQ